MINLRWLSIMVSTATALGIFGLLTDYYNNISPGAVVTSLSFGLVVGFFYASIVGSLRIIYDELEKS